METEKITQDLKAMLNDGVFMDPLLMNTYYHGRMPACWEQAKICANRMYQSYTHGHHFAPGLDDDMPFSPRLLHRCLVETVMSTAVEISNERTGSVVPNEDDLETAKHRVEDWIDKRGMERLYKAYFVIAGYDFLQPMFFHKHVYEADFLNGARHYPYTTEALDLYLMTALARGSVRLKQLRDGRIIVPTKLGQTRFQWMRQSLEESGYLERRIAMSYVYQFDTIEDWDALCDIVWPDGRELRKSYLEWVGIEPGQQVLEVGCGTGVLTFDEGLAERVLPEGHLTAIDVSNGMLDQAQSKYKERGAPAHVTLSLASVEHLPYPEDMFNVALGSAFLHFTNAPIALKEMARVVVKGGIVSILQALSFDLNVPFFNEWFQPILELAKKSRRNQKGTYLPTIDQLQEWFAGAGFSQIEVRQTTASWVFDNPEVVVQHIVRGVSFFQSELVYLPWDDQRTLIMELIDRGRDVCRKYSRTERRLELPSVMVRARK